MSKELAPKPDAQIAPVGIDWNAAIRTAAELGKDGVEVLERIQAMIREEKEQRAKEAFVAAMVALRAELPPITKSVPGAHGVSEKGGRTTGMYAPLDTITPVLDPLCAKYGFVYDFDREVVEGRKDDYVVCIVTHAAGWSKRTRYPAPVGPENRATNSLMAVAIGESYAKRYALVAAFGITTADPDTDAEGADQTVDPSAPRISEAQEADLRALADEVGADVGKYLEYLSRAWHFSEPMAYLSEIPAGHYAEAVKVLERKRR